jgi:Protein of unknown function (DUF4058)
MPGPFPGMDPYIEFQQSWQDFHNRLIAELCNALGMQLPDDYVARVDERIELVDFDGPQGTAFKPDILLARDEGGRRPPRRSSGGPAVATLDPVYFEIVEHDPEEVRHTWLEIRRLPDRELVTVIEVLSPWYKAGRGRAGYLARRRDLHARKIHLVEIDLLLAGRPLPMRRQLRGKHYLAIVARGPALPTAEVYAWSIQDRLPRIPIPLRAPDPDVPIELQPLVDRVYDLGRYGRTLRHDQRLPEGVPLHPDDRSWAEGAR